MSASADKYNFFGDKVKQEALIHDETARQHSSFLDRCDAPRDYYDSGHSLAPMEYANFFYNNKKMKILDIGVGRGESSVYLASLGHEVHCVEPSQGFCDLVSRAAKKFNLNISVYQTVAEDMSQISVKDFDVAVFNASLHHCDDPEMALNKVHKLLKNGGVVYLISETHIRPWVSKKRWYSKMESCPVKMGHYGGNEHAYYNWEYKNMLINAGYKNIKRYPSFMLKDPLYRIEYGLRARINGERVWNLWNAFKSILFYAIITRIVNYKFLFNFISRISLVQTQFVAIK